MKGKKREREWMSNAVIFHHRYANDKSTASWSDTGKKTIQNRSERHFHASCSLLYRHPSICILYNRIFPSFFFFFLSSYSKAASWFNRVYRCKKRLANAVFKQGLNENSFVFCFFFNTWWHEKRLEKRVSRESSLFWRCTYEEINLKLHGEITNSCFHYDF